MLSSVILKCNKIKRFRPSDYKKASDKNTFRFIRVLFPFIHLPNFIRVFFFVHFVSRRICVDHFIWKWIQCWRILDFSLCFFFLFRTEFEQDCAQVTFGMKKTYSFVHLIFDEWEKVSVLCTISIAYDFDQLQNIVDSGSSQYEIKYRKTKQLRCAFSFDFFLLDFCFDIEAEKWRRRLLLQLKLRLQRNETMMMRSSKTRTGQREEKTNAKNDERNVNDKSLRYRCKEKEKCRA